MPGQAQLEKKEEYDRKLCGYLDEFDKALLVHADNVSSKQFQDIRSALRPNSAILMGKNTLMKRCIRLYCERTQDELWGGLLPHLVGNVGVVFTKESLNDVRQEINKYRVGAPARVGVLAPRDVTVPAGPTAMDPSQTSFFQALNIATKINKGSIEIIADVPLIKQGTKVGGSEATLLSKLGIKPFEYGLVPLLVFDKGSTYSPKVLDLSDDDLLQSVSAALLNTTSVSLATGYPLISAVPHHVINGFKNVLSVCIGTDYSFPHADKVKERLENPEAFMAAAPAEAAPAAGGGGGGAAAAKEESEEESSEGGMGGLFD